MGAPEILIVDDNEELATLLGQLFERAGYRSRVVHRGRAAIAAIEENPPAAAVVDILLPDVVGYKVAKHLAKRNIPFVFITGVFRGARLAREGTEREGAKAYFEKPFEAGKLVEFVRGLVPPPPEKPRQGDPDFDLDIDLDLTEAGEPAADLEMTGQIRVEAGAVQALLTGQDFHLPAASPGQVVVRPRPAEPEEERSPDGRVRRGALRDNLPHLIGAFWQLRETGEILLERGKVKKAIFFEKGWPVFAVSNLAAERLGTFLVRVGRITEAQHREAMGRAEGDGRRLGEVLVSMGILQEAERMYYVAQQVKAIIYSAFAWEEGTYRMTFLEKARHEPIRLGIHPAQLIQRAIKKIYPLSRYKRILAPEDRLVQAADPIFHLTEVELETWEAQLLAKATKDRTVAELLASTPRPQPQVYGSLVALMGLKILEKHEPAKGQA
ncbi:MAG: response regulator [Pseudomonadota bacterium]|nr:MAG: two-component system response regulator [Pseudomonadota bacterium]